MPIFQQDLERRESADERMPSPPAGSVPRDTPPSPATMLARKMSEESIRTELCEGPLPDSPKPATPDDNEAKDQCSDRAELIERLKRGESPTWIPNRFVRRPTTPSQGTSLISTQIGSLWSPQTPHSAPRSPRQTTNSSPTLLPPVQITPERGDSTTSDDERRLQAGLTIERPRSALHSGDFTQDESRNRNRISAERQDDREDANFASSRHSWVATSPPRDFTPFKFDRRIPAQRSTQSRSGLSSLSSSLSNSFVYKPPTSPLVQSESNEDLDLMGPMEGINIGSSLPTNPRRHTLYMANSESYGFPSPSPRHLPSLRQERTFPYQAHQPRRSLTSTPNFSLSGPSPQTPAFLRSRRPSISSETSPLQHASMVGSYEESILRGRMSTTPSKPLDFLAQIGVLGLGKCKSSLRCPPHVTLPFPAVFYSYSSSSLGPSKVEDGPSPYVGQVDLENGLPDPEIEQRAKRKLQSRNLERRMAEGEDVKMADRTPDNTDRDTRRVQRHRRAPGSPKAPPGGSYRIPEKGQIQIIIKNQNKTAVKLFLVPYDLAGMEPGTKTFIRQRSYSAGPIIDNVPDLKDTGSADRPILRYLVHLHICCPSKGRFYLYKSIRVVFANRVPDGKEKLRNEITLPEPRFTPYKPIRVMHTTASIGSGPGASLAAEKAFRRRSSGFYFGSGAQNFNFDAMEGLGFQTFNTGITQNTPPFNLPGNNQPVEPIPFRVPSGQRGGASESGESALGRVRSPDPSQGSRPTTTESSNGSMFEGTFSRYDKLNKGDVGYGGNAFTSSLNGSPGVAEGLLSQRLKSLGVQQQPTEDEDKFRED